MPWLNIDEALTDSPIVPEWIVPGLLPKDYAVVLVGQPGAGKSFLSMGLALSVATGLPFLGRNVEAARVLYINQENALMDTRCYLRQLWIGMGSPSKDMLRDNLMFAHFSLIGGGKARFEETVRLAAEVKPQLIIVDTLVSAFPPESISGENDNAEAARQLVQLRAAQAAAETKASLWLLKHAKEGENVGMIMRGAKYWNGAADSTLYHGHAAGRPRSDGLFNTKITPTKGRAFGLKHTVTVIPELTSDNQGVVLSYRNNYSSDGDSGN